MIAWVRFSKEIIARLFKIGVVLLILAQFACSSISRPTSPGAEAVTEKLAPTATTTAEAATETLAPTAKAGPEPSPTPKVTVLDLEVLEWAVYPYANLADPQNTDTRLEILVRA